MSASNAALDACLSDAQLDRFHAGELSAEDGRAAAAHLDTCANCRGRAMAMRSEHESGLALLRSAGIPPQDELHAPVPTAPVALERDAVAGYEIMEEIGRGGQGVVYRAVQRGTKRDVALKVLREGLWAAPTAQRRFEREIELSASLNHPNIVTVFDSGQTRDGRRFVAMDLVRGQPLGRWCADRNQRQRLALMAQICHAVNHAHQHGVIHRDLKPGNILVTKGIEGSRDPGIKGAQAGTGTFSIPRSLDPSIPAPKILDFGLARSQADAAGATLTGLSHVAGTLAYMSPEHARGKPETIDTRSDVYALGVILYEVVTGGFPYPVKGDTIEVLRHIAESAPAPPRRPLRQRGEGSIDADLETIILKALDKEPARRYQTAGDLGRDIEHYLAGEPIEARRDSAWYVVRKALRRHRLGVGVAAAFLLLIVGSTIALAVLYAEQRRLRAAAESNATQARLAEARATQRFEDVRALARTFIFDFDPKIARLPGAAPARKLLVEKALEYLDRLSTEAEGDPNLQWELASAYDAIGDVQGDAASSNLGASADALKSYEKARAILLRLVQRQSDDLRAAATLQAMHVKMTDALGGAQRIAEALESSQAAIDLGQRLVDRLPGDRARLDSLANAHERRGNLLLSEGRVDEALEEYRINEQIGKSLAQDADPTNLWEARQRAVVLTKMAQILYQRGEKEVALEKYRQFLAAVEPLRASEPVNLVPRHDVATAQQWICILLAELDRPQEAIDACNASLVLFEGLLRDESDSDDARMNVVTTLSRLGDVRLALDQRDAARAAFERCLPLIEAQGEKTPDSAGARRLRGVCYYKMSRLLQAEAECAENANDAKPAVREALSWLERTRAAFVEMQEYGTLACSDEGVLDELADEIHALEAQIE